MSLLNLLQRVGVLEVVSGVSEKGDRAGTSWDIEIKIPGILEDANSQIWDRVFEKRDREQAASLAEFNDFLHLMSRPAEQCLVRGVFDLLEEDAPDLPDCGRCPSCRARSRHPPRSLDCWGLETGWPCLPGDGTSILPLGVTLIAPRDPTYETGFDDLIRRLAACGIEQFVVPDQLAARTAQMLAESQVRFGFVLTHTEVLNRPAASLACLPTGFLLPLANTKAAADLLRRVQSQRSNAPTLSIAVVAEPQRDGRRGARVP